MIRPCLLNRMRVKEMMSEKMVVIHFLTMNRWVLCRRGPVVHESDSLEILSDRA